MSIDVFLSVGRTYTDAQEKFVVALETILRTRGLQPRTVGRNDFSSDAPIRRIVEVMDGCHGTVVLAFERTRSSEFVDRPDSPEESKTPDVRLPTVWNQIEATISYVQRKPLLVIVQKGLRDEGLLEARYDWYVQWIELTDDALRTDEFQAVLGDWVQKVSSTSTNDGETGNSRKTPRDLTLKDLLGGLTVPQAWALAGAVITVLTVVATVAYRLGAIAH